MSEKKGFLGLHPNVFFLGLVSFLTDVSSEMIFTTLPLFLANVLGVKTGIIGLIEGVAESTATILRIFSGWLSDKIGKRKALAVTGYGLSTAVKPLMLLAGTWTMVLAVRFSDRLGKGIRSAPRDALIADSTDEGNRGKSFGFHRAMDTGGAMLGILIAAALVYFSQRDSINLTLPAYRMLVVAGTIPAVIGVLVLIFLVRERKRESRKSRVALPEIPESLKKFSPGRIGKWGFDIKFKIFLGVLMLFTLGNSSDAFLILRAQNIGVSTFRILLMLALFNIVYSLLSTPAGALSDKLGRKGIIAVGWSVFALTRIGFALVTSQGQVIFLFAVYGIYYALSEGVARAYVADMVPVEKRGTAYGLYYGAIGVTALPASVLAGWLWQTVGPSAPFFFGAGLTATAVIALITLVRH